MLRHGPRATVREVDTCGADTGAMWPQAARRSLSAGFPAPALRKMVSAMAPASALFTRWPSLPSPIQKPCKIAGQGRRSARRCAIPSGPPDHDSWRGFSGAYRRNGHV